MGGRKRWTLQRRRLHSAAVTRYALTRSLEVRPGFSLTGRTSKRMEPVKSAGLQTPIPKASQLRTNAVTRRYRRQDKEQGQQRRGAGIGGALPAGAGLERRSGGGGETARPTKRGFDAQLPMVKSAEPSGVGVSAFRRPNGSIARLSSGVSLNLITSLSESRNSSRPVVGMMIELRRPHTSSVIRKNVPCRFSFRSNVICFRSIRSWAVCNCVSITDT